MPAPQLSDRPLVLEIPAAAAHLVTARAFAESVARQSGMGEERVVNVKLAISEIATWLILAAPPGGSISIRATVTERGVQIEVEPFGFPMPAEDESASSLDLVRAVTEEMILGSAVTFRLARSD